MTQNDLSDVIHSSVCNIFNANQEKYIEVMNALIKAKNDDLSSALFNYTMTTSELICAATVDTLRSMGILNIPES